MRLGIAAFVALCFPVLGGAAPATVASFAGYPEYDDVKISPGGHYLVLTRRKDEYQTLTVLHYPDLKASLHTHFGSQTDIETLVWATDTRLLLKPARRFPAFISYKEPTGEVIGLNVDGTGKELLFGYQAGDFQTSTLLAKRASTYAYARIVDRVPGNDREVLIQSYGYGDYAEANTAYWLNILNGKLDKIAGSPLRNSRFITDARHQVALVAGTNLEGDNEVFRLVPGTRDWEKVSRSQREAGALRPIGPSGSAGEFIVLDDRDAPTLGAFLWSPASGARRLLFRNDNADLRPLGSDPANKPWGFEYFDHFPSYWYPDPEHPLAKAHHWLRTLYKDHHIEIGSQTDDMSLAVAQVSGPHRPPLFLVIDVRKLQVQQQLSAYPRLEPAALANVDPIEFIARDGMKIRGYLTVPGSSPQKKLPLIALVHMGPDGYSDKYMFDPQAQLLASRGYAVLQVNFRGSGGRGRAFSRAGFGRWGREMQDDITDGVKWAIGDGVADAGRVCLYGTGYGAYAALTGTFREPDMFRCAVGVAGFYDLPLMFEKGRVQSFEAGVNYLKEALGTDTEDLKRRSPVYNADKIRAAVLLVHGKVDAAAPFEHALRMKAALARAGNPPEWHSEWGEGHDFVDEARWVRATERILAFFDKHLAPAGSTTTTAVSTN